MSKIEYKTRGNSSPQGKPRVFVFFHQEDAIVKNDEKSPFDLVCEDILASQNCAIYYESEWDNPVNEEELSSLLSDVQLFVMIVSTNFLFRNDIQSIRTIYNIASAHHIPILPITVEYGIDKYFAERMNNIQTGAGDVQFLDRTAKDPTKIPYQEQLDKYLNSVLVGDELAQRVRAAFDAYIFMSYRKIDRQYAQELMRLIHNIPFCRDIAIWYDEYLVPGEAFRDAIRDAMEKSRLVTIAVTPSLAEPNFISKHEYPYAKELKKEVIPAEVKKTDRALLKDLFEDMPEFVNGTDIDAMTERLQQLATTSNEESPEHNFLIGLAYLNAIDVERDVDRALQLIQSAAEANLPEAIKKLVDMYNTGEGVQRDYKTAIEWQRKYVAAIEKVGFSQGDVAASLVDLGDMEQAVGSFSAAKEYFKTSYDIFKQLMEETNTADSRLGFVGSCSRIGVILQANGNFSAAKEYYKKGYDVSKQLMEEMNTIASRRDFAFSCNRIGNILQAEGNLDAAKEYFIICHNILKQLTEETNAIDFRYYFAFSFNLLGDILQAEGNLNAAKEHIKICHNILKQLRDETNTLDFHNYFAINCNKLGDILHTEGNLDAAKEYYKKGYDVSKQLMEETNTINSHCVFAVNCDRLGGILYIEGDLNAAKEYFKTSYDISKQLMEEMNTIASRRDFAFSCNRIGNILQAEGNLDAAKEYFKTSYDIFKQLMEETNTIDSRHGFALSCNRLGDILHTEGNLDAAKEYYKKEYDVSKQLMEEMNTIASRRDFAFSCNRIGNILQAEGNLDAAKEYCTKSVELFKQLAKEVHTLSSNQDLSKSQDMLYKINKELRKQKLRKLFSNFHK